MIPFTMIVIDELRDGPPEVALTERNHPIETLLFNRAHEAFGMGTGGRPWALRIRAIVERPTRCPTFFSAPWIRV